MEEFLKKIKLLNEFTVNLNIDKNIFASAFKNQVEEKDIDSFLSSAFEVFSSNKKRYKGFVNFNEFKIREKQSFGNRKFGNIKAIGRFSQKGERLEILTKINGWTNFMFIYFGFTLVFYCVFLGLFFSGFTSINNEFYFILPFIFIHAIFMFGLPIYQIRKGVSKLKDDLEREFHFVVSKITHSQK
jgi:hypothetical protein